MDSTSRNSLLNFCRTCLNSTTTGQGYNVLYNSELRKLMVLFTLLDEEEFEYENYFPKSLCTLCFDKMMDFQEFRNLARESGLKLKTMIAGKIKTNDQQDSHNHVDDGQKETMTLEYENNDSTIKMSEEQEREKQIKLEPLDIEDYALQTQNFQCVTNDFNDSGVKAEIDSEYEDDDNSNFYENNALDGNVGEEADDEECELRNGAKNSSSTSEKQNSTSAARKRNKIKKSLKCPRCEKQVYKKIYLEAHIRAVHEGYEKPFMCQECPKAFTRYNQLHLHIKSNHLMQQLFNCGFQGCDATFDLKETLDSHFKVVHIGDASFSAKIIQFQSDNKEKDDENICQQCLRKYSSKRALVDHIKRHNQVKNYACNVCGVAKVTRTELLTHKRTHETNIEKFKCTMCPQEFNHKNSISRHVRVVHEGERRYACNFCPKNFGTRNSQMSHERLHTGERPYNCDVCHKDFAQLVGLKSHMKNHDKTLRKHVCSFCSKRFITKKNLLDHEERHRGIKSHICNICSKGFFRANDLEWHYKSAHPGDETAGVLLENDNQQSIPMSEGESGEEILPNDN